LLLRRDKVNSVYRTALVSALVALATAAGAPGATAPVTAEALLAADVPWATVQQVAGASWWPSIPQFESPPLWREPLPVKPVAVSSLWFRHVDGGETIVTRLLAFARSDPGYCRAVAAGDGVPVDARAPAVGDAHLYWHPDADTTVLCFERGRVAVEVRAAGSWPRERIARLARPADANVQSLLAGRPKAPAVAAATLARLPAADAAPGRALGTTVLGPEAWGANAGRPGPREIRSQLTRGGATLLPYRRYVLPDRTNVIDVTLFPFAGPTAARGWFRTLADSSSVASTGLDPGATGPTAGSWLLDDYVALDFVAGRFVADVTCYRPGGGQPSSACAPAVRTLAEHWYVRLARGR
jgi:hypothetical protein